MNDLLQQGISAFKSGDRETARKLFITAVKQNPDSERAWGWMYNVCTNDKERIHCLKQMLRINPKGEKANKLLVELTSFEPPLEHPRQKSVVNIKSKIQDSSPVSKTTSIIIAISLGIVLIVLAFGPIWPSFEAVKQYILQYYFGKYFDEGLSLNQMDELLNAPNSPAINALRIYDMSIMFRNVFIGICILFLLFEVFCILKNKTIVSNLFWYFLGFFFVAFSLEYLFLSWSLFVTPGPILSSVSALLFIFFGLSRIKSKTQ